MRLPALVGQALRLAWRAGPADTVTTVALNLMSGVFTALGLLATTGVLDALLAAGPTPERVRAALPSLLLVGGAAILRSLLSAAAGWAQARLTPRVQQRAEVELYEVTSRIDLASYDDSEFYEALMRAEGPGASAAQQVVSATIDIVTGVTSFAAAAIAITTLHPVLLPLLLVTALPEAWAAIRVARSRYVMMVQTVGPRYHSVILGDLLSNRRYAADLRSYTLQGLLLAQYRRVADVYRDAQLRLARKNVATRLAGDAGSGLAGGLVYLVLALLLAAAWLPLAVGTAVLAIRTSRAALSQLVHAVNECYEQGLYLTDYTTFLATARTHLPPLLPPPTSPAASPRSPWRTCRSPIPGPTNRPCGTCRSPCPPGRSWHWSGRTDRARARWPSCSPTCTRRGPAASAGTGWTSRTPTPRPYAHGSRSSRRTTPTGR